GHGDRESDSREDRERRADVSEERIRLLETLVHELPVDRNIRRERIPGRIDVRKGDRYVIARDTDDRLIDAARWSVDERSRRPAEDARRRMLDHADDRPRIGLSEAEAPLIDNLAHGVARVGPTELSRRE